MLFLDIFASQGVKSQTIGTLKIRNNAPLWINISIGTTPCFDKVQPDLFIGSFLLVELLERISLKKNSTFMRFTLRDRLILWRDGSEGLNSCVVTKRPLQTSLLPTSLITPGLVLTICRSGQKCKPGFTRWSTKIPSSSKLPLQCGNSLPTLSKARPSFETCINPLTKLLRSNFMSKLKFFIHKLNM